MMCGRNIEVVGTDNMNRGRDGEIKLLTLIRSKYRK